MEDPRVRKLARTLVRYSIEAKRMSTVGIAISSEAEPLAVALYEEVLKAGAFPALRMAPANLQEQLFRCGRPHHFTQLTPLQRAYARCVDATISVRAQSNTRALSNVSPRKQAMLAKTNRPVGEQLRRKPWVVTIFPTAAYAQDAEMSLAEFEDFVFAAMFCDRSNPIAAWKALHRRQQKLIGKLAGADRIRIIGPGTDLAFSVKGRTFVNSDGHHNMPSGEVFTAPVEDSAEGFIEYDYPVCRAGREVDGVRLVFRKGRVVEASARKNEAYLKAMLDTDRGARRLGELGIGTNQGITKFIKHILFDEKIGGTVHLAIGSSPLETGGRNRSAIHWDMIKDLRRGGKILVDGKVFQEDGKFV